MSSLPSVGAHFPFLWRLFGRGALGASVWAVGSDFCLRLHFSVPLKDMLREISDFDVDVFPLPLLLLSWFLVTFKGAPRPSRRS